MWWIASCVWLHEGPPERGEEHHKDDDERQGRGGDLLEPEELGHEGVNDQGGAAEGGDRAVGLHALGREKMGQLIDGGGEDQEHEDQDAHAAGFDVVDVDGFLEPPIEIEHAQQGRDHEGAVGQSIAKRLLHGLAIACRGEMLQNGHFPLSLPGCRVN